MASESTFSESEAVVLGRLIGPERANLPVATARAILKLDFEPRDHERMHELSGKAKEGRLTAEERAEIDAYGRVGCLLDLMHSLARRSLNAKGVPEDEVRFLEETPTVLSDRDRDAFLALLDNPPPPNEALRRAAEKYKKRHG
jgi:hypothetical protein